MVPRHTFLVKYTLMLLFIFLPLGWIMDDDRDWNSRRCRNLAVNLAVRLARSFRRGYYGYSRAGVKRGHSRIAVHYRDFVF